MSREWRPGDVAVATVYGKPNIRVMATSGVEWVTHQGFAASDRGGDTTGNVADVRPLVVIDPEDREQVVVLMNTFWKQRGNRPLQEMGATQMQAALREFACPTPPKPEEPTGLGAVVEDAEGVRWTRVKDGFAWRWRDDRFGEQTTWPHIDVVRELSPGWSE